MRIKLNENENSGMLYAIAYCEDPDIYSEEFWGWDTESDVGYELMEFGSLIQDADVFDSLEAAEDRADDVLSSIFEDEVFIVGLDPYTPHNLTGFVKKINRTGLDEDLEEKIIDLFIDSLNGWSWDSWSSTGIRDLEEIVVDVCLELNIPKEERSKVYELFYDWAEGLSEDDFPEDFDDYDDEDFDAYDDLDESKSIKEYGVITEDILTTIAIDTEIDGDIIDQLKAFRKEYIFGKDSSRVRNSIYTILCEAPNGTHLMLKLPTSFYGNSSTRSLTEYVTEYTKQGYDWTAISYSRSIDGSGVRLELRTSEPYKVRARDIVDKITHYQGLPVRKNSLKESINESKSIKESATGDYVEVAYICDGFTNFRVFGGGFKTSDALVSVEDDKGKRLRLTMSDVCEFYTWYDAKGNVIHEPTYYSED